VEFRVVGHACMIVEAAGQRLVVDPWLVDPIYWGAWSHCPAPVYEESIYDAEHVFITHWHYDHFDAGTLRGFSRDCHFWVPRFPVSSMAGELRDLGFQQVTEMIGGRRYTLGPDFAITSFQIQYLDDSVLAVEAEGVVIVDLNDSKPLPPSWRAIRRRFPRPDFMLRSHSPAWSFPDCYRFEDPADAVVVQRESYMAGFREAARMLSPRFAIPFASGVCHLHREARAQNEHLVPARELLAYLQANPLPDTEVVEMPPGASWSPEDGFRGTEAAADLDFEAEVARLADEQREELESLYAAEDAVVLSFDDFSAYFQEFLRRLGPFRRFLRSVWVFRIRQLETSEFWRVDFAHARIERLLTEPEGYTSRIDVHAGLLADALEQGIFANLEIAKRWTVHVRKGGVTGHLLLWVLISLSEAGYLTPRNLFRPRFIAGYTRRFPELLHYVLLFVRVMRRGVSAAAETVTRVEPS
jgi:hypothetical protein